MVRRKPIGAMILYYLVLTFLAVLVIIPMVWMIGTSFETFKTYSLPFPPSLLPKEPTLDNYRFMFMNVPILRYIRNTICVALISLALNVIISTLTGFVLSKGNFRGKNILLLVVLSNLMVPFETKLLPMYSVILNLGLANNWLGVVLPSAMTSGMYIYFTKQFCDDLPDDLYNAGIVDGAGKLRIFFQIFLPLLKPIIATIIVLDVINVWNDLLWPMIVLTDPNVLTVQLGLTLYNTGATGQVHAGINLALSVISILPLALVFCFMQRYIVQSIAFSGMKQ